MHSAVLIIDPAARALYRGGDHKIFVPEEFMQVSGMRPWQTALLLALSVNLAAEVLAGKMPLRSLTARLAAQAHVMVAPNANESEYRRVIIGQPLRSIIGTAPRLLVVGQADRGNVFPVGLV